MLAMVDMGTRVGHVSPWPTWGHPEDPVGGGGVGGAAVLGPLEGAPYLRFLFGAELGFGQIRLFSSNLAYRGLENPLKAPRVPA
jgi:hypothetical protein